MYNGLIAAFSRMGVVAENAINNGVPLNPIKLIMSAPLEEEWDFTIENGITKDNLLFEAFLASCKYCDWSGLYEEQSPTIAQKAGGAVQTAGSVIRKAGDAVKKFASNPGVETSKAIGAGVAATKQGAATVQRNVNPILNTIQRGISWFDELNNEDKRSMVIEGSFFTRVRRLFFKVFAYMKAYPLLFALMPGGFIFILIKCFMLVKGTKSIWSELTGEEYNKARNRVIQELELELKMCREKIEDSRSDGNRKAKYQLMRLENQIENEIMRIKYGHGA